MLGFIMTLRTGQSHPSVANHIILRNPTPGDVHSPEEGLSGSDALFGGGAKPAGGLGVVLRNTAPDAVHVPEVVLSASEALFGGAEPPADGLGGVLRHAPPLSYMPPRLFWAIAWPCSAAARYQRTASAASSGTPSPVWYRHPR